MSGGDEEIVAAVLAGDLDVGDPRVATLPSSARERLDSMLRVQRELAAAAAREREQLHEVDLLAKGPLPAEVGTFLAGVGRGDPAAKTEVNSPPLAHPRFGVRRLAGVAALAAGLLLLAYAARLLPPRATGDRAAVGSGTLGARADVVAIDPVGPLDRFDARAPFHWRGELPRLARFELCVWAHDESRVDGKGELLARRELATPAWIPDVTLPDHFHWRVDVKPFEGSALPGPEVEAWRRR